MQSGHLNIVTLDTIRLSADTPLNLFFNAEKSLNKNSLKIDFFLYKPVLQTWTKSMRNVYNESITRNKKIGAVEYAGSWKVCVTVCTSSNHKGVQLFFCTMRLFQIRIRFTCKRLIKTRLHFMC